MKVYGLSRNTPLQTNNGHGHNLNFGMYSDIIKKIGSLNGKRKACIYTPAAVISSQKYINSITNDDDIENTDIVDYYT